MTSMFRRLKGLTRPISRGRSFSSDNGPRPTWSPYLFGLGIGLLTTWVITASDERGELRRIRDATEKLADETERLRRLKEDK